VVNTLECEGKGAVSPRPLGSGAVGMPALADQWEGKKEVERGKQFPFMVLMKFPQGKKLSASFP